MDAIFFVIVFVASIFLFFIPQRVDAAAHHLSCVDFPTEAIPDGVICPGADTVVYNGADGLLLNIDDGIQFEPGTYYLSFTAEGTGTGYAEIRGDFSSYGALYFEPGDTVDYEIEVTSGDSSWNSVAFAGGFFPMTPVDFVGDVTGICWSDAPGECAGTPTTTPTGFSPPPVRTAMLDCAMDEFSMTCDLLYYPEVYYHDWLFALSIILFFLVVLAGGFFLRYMYPTKSKDLW